VASVLAGELVAEIGFGRPWRLAGFLMADAPSVAQSQRFFRGIGFQLVISSLESLEIRQAGRLSH
jgi:hypothetical protein